MNMFKEKRPALTVEKVEQAIMKAWAADTSSRPELWTPESPALGQGTVTALVMQDYLGGALVKKEVKSMPGYIHYYNLLSTGLRDLTKSQFAEGTAFGPAEFMEREDILFYPDTMRRYEILRARVSVILNKRFYERIQR
jgi:hypothetical protein